MFSGPDVLGSEVLCRSLAGAVVIDSDYVT
jgi:hypothetical protein